MVRVRDENAIDPQPVPRLVVGVGASAGGLEAFKSLLGALPCDSGMAFLFVQHLAPAHKSLLADLLATHTEMPVVTIEDRLPLRPNTVYVAPADSSVLVSDGRLKLTPFAVRQKIRLPIDHLFRSLAREYGARSAAVVLSGAGSDGSAGIRELKAAGGLTIAQEPASAGQAGMPQSAIDTGCVDLVLQLSDMGLALRRFDTLPQPARVVPNQDNEEATAAAPIAPLPPHVLDRMGNLLESKANFDLRVYKAGTVQRRVVRRMTLTGHNHLDSYVSLLEASSEEQQALVRDLLISVTDFFRDREAFESLRELAIDPLVSTSAPGEPVRVWVPACASGEEVYSLAIEILEAFRRHEVQRPLQIFGTDIDQAALAAARAGHYPTAVAEHVSGRLLERYFQPVEGSGYQVRQGLRDVVSFAVHDLTRDPPFSRMSLVSCRNLLIYLRPDAQEQVLKLLHFALQPGGFLFLGSSESTGAKRELFSTLSKKWRIYRKVGASRPLLLARGAQHAVTHHEPPLELPSARTFRGRERRVEPTFREVAGRAVMRARVPPTIVVGQSGRVLFMHGELRPFLKFPEGDPQFDLASLVTPDLATRTRAALYKCRRDHQTVVAHSSIDPEAGERIKITASPAFELGDDAVIISFEEERDVVAAPLASPDSPAHEAVIEELERELIATREDLRSTVEELESSNEELISSNEEATSMNEELQSANEELEATTEELRSLNEELTTVNVQLREKVEALEQAHDDLANFFEGTKIATLFLNERLRIKRFTPAAEELLRLTSQDEGRFVGDIARELLQNRLVEEAKQVLEHLVVQSRELETAEGRWLVRRVLPYRTEDRRIEGVVITFVDVTDLKQATEQLAVRAQQQAVIARLGARALEDPNLDSFLEQAVGEVNRTLRTDFCNVLELQPGGDVFLLRAGVGWKQGAVLQEVVSAEAGSQAGFTLTARLPVVVDDLDQERRFAAPALLLEHGIKSGVSCVIRGGDEPYGVLAVYSRAPRTFTSEETNFLQAIAAVMTGAVNRHETQRRLALERSAARALSQSRSFQQAARQFHQGAADIFGPGVGEVWQLTAEGELARTAVFAAGSYTTEQVERDFGPCRFPRGEGLQGRVLATGRAEWLSSLQHKKWFKRVGVAREMNLATGIAFPIPGPNRVTRVITYFSRDRIYANAVFLRSLEGIGRAFGDFLRRLDIEQRFRLTFARAPVGIADLDLRGRWLRINARFSEITGYTSKELVNSCTPISHPEDRERESQLFESLRQGQRDSFTIEQRYLRKDGTPVWVTLSAALVGDPREDSSYCVAIIQDISARKAAEAELEDSELRFRQALMSSPAPMMLYDEQGNIAVMNHAWTEVTGYSLQHFNTLRAWTQHALGQSGEAVPPFQPGPWENHSTSRRSEQEITTRSGEVRTLVFDSVYVGDARDGRRMRVVAAADVTQQRRFERELMEASRHKDEFIAMLGHELRNPLAAVRSATELLKRTHPADGRIQRMQGILERQTAHMAQLLDGLLDISRVMRGKIVLEAEPVDLVAVVNEMVNDAQHRLEPRGITLSHRVPEEGVWVEGDRMRLTQIVDNLISNAIKYTPAPGSIEVELTSQNGQATLAVRDTGVGIDPNLLAGLFVAFQQGAQSLDRSSGGLGLGLALVKLLAELHGGRVEAHSEGVGQGAQFVVRLPLTQHRPPSQEQQPARAASRRILIIEDNEDAAEMLCSVLELRGHEVMAATRGQEGIELARRHQPELILCDLGLPDGVTGYDVAETLRADPHTQHLRLIALSGYGRPEDKQRSKEAGFEIHLTKPVSLEDLEGIL